MKTILVTGAGGFIGSHLTELLVQKGYHVKAFVRYNSNSLKGWLAQSAFKKDIEFSFGDVRDYDSVSKALKGCDSVFHLAALIGIPYSYQSPLAYIKTNVEGTYNVLEAAKNLSLKNIMITSTSETYGTAQYVPIDELHPANAQSPYAASKVAADQLALSYHRSFGLAIKIVRPFNTYGPRQSLRAIIPTVISQVLSGKKELFLGNVTPTRDFTFVKDTVEGFLAIAKSPKLNGQVTNIGTNTEISIKALVEKISNQLQRKVRLVKDKKRLRPDKSEVERLRADNRKLKKLAKFMPSYTMDNGLKETIFWVRNHLKNVESENYHV